MGEEAEVDPVVDIVDDEEAPVEEAEVEQDVAGEAEVEETAAAGGDEEEAGGGEEGGDDEGGEEGEDDDDDDDEDDEDEEDPIDPYETNREKCANSPACAHYMDMFNECETRVKSKSQTEENCSQEILDFFHCQDHCAAKGLFASLK